MKVELHLIQNFSPASLNRDDTNSPKDCEFGGHRRARISSQALKRAIRMAFSKQALLPPEVLSTRTRKLFDLVARTLADDGHDESEARNVAVTALRAAGLDVSAEGRTEYLLFMGRSALDEIAALCSDHWDDLSELSDRISAALENLQEGRGARRGQSPKEVATRMARDGAPSGVRDRVLQALQGKRSADLALFGRMLADLPEHNVDGACQVAHAISTNRVSMETDFYTAVDDEQAEGEPAAGMMGIIGYNSSCFYRYSVVDMEQLSQNLGGDSDLARRAVEAFIRASVMAIPAGRQNSSAAFNPPDAILAVVRESGIPVSLANAFADPIQPGRGESLIRRSVEAADRYWGKTAAVYGESDVAARPFCLVSDEANVQALADQRVGTLDDLVATVIRALA